MPFPARESQTRIKHFILHAYAGAWAGIIVGGLRQRSGGGFQRQVDLAYLDGYAGAGAYDGEADKSNANPVAGSPIIGMSVLESVVHGAAAAALSVRLTGVAIEADGANYRELVERLNNANLQTPLAEAARFEASALGRLTAIHGDARDHVPDVVQQLPRDAFMLALLDPYGPGMPLDMVAKVVGRRRSDCIIFFPTSDVYRKAVTASKAPDAWDANDRANITRYDNLFGGQRWREIATAPGLTREEREARYVALYHELLEDAMPEGVVKEIGLRFSSMPDGGYHLFLTTADADGALKMNEILRREEYREHWTLWADWEARLQSRAEATEGYTLGLDVPYRAKPQVEKRKPDPAESEGAVLGVLQAGESLTMKRLFERLANDVFTRSEIVGAVARLAKQDRLEWDGSKGGRSVILVRP